MHVPSPILPPLLPSDLPSNTPTHPHLFLPIAGVEPDVLTSAKALGAGVPIGAMLCKVGRYPRLHPSDLCVVSTSVWIWDEA